jgi:hypothetical protein
MLRRYLLVAMLVLVVRAAFAQAGGQSEIAIGGLNFTLGMPKDQVLGTLSHSFEITENKDWSAAHKPDSLWWLSDLKNRIIKGGVKFKAGKLDGAMVVWSPDSSEGTDFAASLVNLLERLSKAGAKNCTLNTEQNTMPQQEQRTARFQCGLRSVVIEHDRFGLLYKGEKMPDGAGITEGLNW